MPDFTEHSLSIVAILAAAGCLLWIYNQAMVAFGKSRLPQPLDVMLKKEFVEKEVYEADLGTIDGRLTAATKSRKEMHQRLTCMEERTARLEEQNKSQTDALNLLSADFREYAREQRDVNRALLTQTSKKP